MTVIVPVTADGRTDHSWGKARRVAVATVSAGAISAWEETDVRWDASHDEGTEGSHHARIARFLRDNGVETVLADHLGPGMQRMLATMGITVLPVAVGEDARAAVLAVVGAA